ncbi:hypothetical protein [Levilactobacillus andaensis]|uniref:hypothetical protein n=1 Tax=Levilactobacillus andaensis TaxID=2799570 RepID=UPI001943F819|nr:hypothetical protein [Levilactobacillus andaensis]
MSKGNRQINDVVDLLRSPQARWLNFEWMKDVAEAQGWKDTASENVINLGREELQKITNRTPSEKYVRSLQAFVEHAPKKRPYESSCGMSELENFLSNIPEETYSQSLLKRD